MLQYFGVYIVGLQQMAEETDFVEVKVSGTLLN